jgi:hypothetical protein
MAKEIEISVKVNDAPIVNLRQQFRQAREEVIALQQADIIDPAKIQAATLKAGALKDAIADANEQIAVMAGGSEFEKVSNGLGLIGSQLMNMDFEGAAASAKNLTGVIKAMSPETVAAGFKNMISTVAQLGKAFVTMGLQLLANPLFLLVAVVTAIVVAIVMLKDKIKIVEVAFNMLMAPINLIIEGLKSLSDWLGITQFEMEATAEASLQANEKMATSSKKRQSELEKEYDRRINLMKAEGKDTTALEIEKTKVTQAESAKRITSYNNEIAKQRELLDGQTKEQQKATNEKINNLRKERDTDLEINKDAANQVKVINATKNKELSDAEQKARDKRQDTINKANEREKAELQRHKDALKALELKYADEIESLGDKTEEEKLQTQKAREQREINNLKAKGLNVSKVQKELDEKYNILETNLAQDKVDKLKAITEGYNKEILLIKDKSRQTQLAQEEANALAEIDKVTQDETKKEEAKKAVRDKYALLKREADALTYEEENTKALADTEQTQMRFEERYAIVDEQDQLLKEQTNLTEEERKRIEQENSAARISIAQAELAAKTATLDAIGGALGGFTELVGKETAAGKALAIAQATISAYTGIANVWGAPSPYPEPYGTAVKIASTVAVATSAFANIKKIISTKVPGKAGSSGGSAPSGGSGASAPTTPSLGLTGNTTQFNQTSAGEARVAQTQPTFTVRAVVSETEITDTQNRVGRMRVNAEL